MPRLVDADWLHEKIAEAQTKLELDSMSNPKYWERVDKKYHKGLAWARKIINEAITIEINSFRPHGHWVEYDCYIGNSEGNAIAKTGTVWVCSECGREEPKREPYCHCGAKMDLEEAP